MRNRGYEINHYTYFLRQRLEAVMFFIKICKSTKCFDIKVVFFKSVMVIYTFTVEQLTIPRSHMSGSEKLFTF